MTRLVEGQKLDGFVVHECLHTGGMAYIYRVEYDLDLGHNSKNPGFDMIMKIPRMREGDGGENIIGFEIERQILPAVSGPHVPRFVAAGDLDSLPYLVMEYIPGVTLEHIMDEAQTLSPETIATMGSAMARAAHSLHKQNVCHLDLKPANVLFRKTAQGDIDFSQAVLLDFGLSWHAHYPDLMAEELRKAVGSPAWIAPEQVVGVRGDPRSDVFAIGVMLYQLATGRLPFGAPSTQGGLRQRLWMNPVPPRVRRADLPEWFQEVVLKCLEPEAVRRYPSAAHLAFELNNPVQVRITERGQRLVRTSFWVHFKRWLRAAGMQYHPSPLPERQIADVPIVMVAVPNKDVTDATLYSLREAVQRSMGLRPGARLAVVTVIRQGLLSGSSNQSESEIQRHHLNLLKQWAQPLTLDAHHISFHVLEANDVAEALLSYAAGNHVNLIIMGAATHGLQMQRLMRTVPIKVAMYASCSVMLIKAALPFEQLLEVKEDVYDGLDVFKTW
ncbi:MAG TPA: bifunctional serine/threonine-protein kinase/universal stress protein [Limnobacter sp.]|uniref:bifunctional serine/threonine-protein kinase/universal stress protein n=1 Tax=Limnobacter sp. TaxID=2003368 RepID=UPI002EDB17B9